ncbi:MAG: monofunctional biosynthetic peptidoglycan transglycosylase [Desulfobulbia bacterium]
MNSGQKIDRSQRIGKNKRRWLFKIVLLTPVAIFAYFTILILAYLVFNPSLSTLMAGFLVSGKTITQQWAPLDKISRHLPLAVIVSEDARYCEHLGVDWQEIERNWSRKSYNDQIRGASTIPMQTMKNLFLWPGRSILRKAMEIPLAYESSIFWSKKRMIEIYLNIVEWGPGIFGAEAASRYHFNKRASHLTQREAALLAVSLPNPRLRNAGKPGPRLRQLARLLQRRMQAGQRYSACIR